MHYPKDLLMVLNQLYELERKLNRADDSANLGRNVSKMKDAFEELGLIYEDPMGQPFNETRTDLEAEIAGAGTENLVVVDVIKPIIRAIGNLGQETTTHIVQKGIVVVESQEENHP